MSRLRTRGVTLLALILALTACGNDDGVSARHTSTSTTGSTARPQPTSPPRESRHFAHALAAGKLLVFGGEVPGTGETVDVRPPRPSWLEEATLYDLASDQWVRPADPPFDRALDDPVAVGLGDSFVVIGLQCPKRTWDYNDDWSCDSRAPFKGAIYRVGTNRWETIELPAETKDPWAIGGLGTEAAFGMSEDRLLLVDTVTLRSRVLGRPSIPVDIGKVCISETRLTAVRATDEAETDETQTQPLALRLDGVSLEPGATRWSAPATLAEGTAPLGYPVYCAGHTAVVTPFHRRQRDGREVPSYAFDGTTWRRVASPAVDIGDQPSVWTGTELVIWGGSEYFGDPSVRAYNLLTDSWRRVVLARVTGYAYRLWTGSDVLVYPGDGLKRVSRIAMP